MVNSSCHNVCLSPFTININPVFFEIFFKMFERTILNTCNCSTAEILENLEKNPWTVCNVNTLQETSFWWVNMLATRQGSSHWLTLCLAFYWLKGLMGKNLAKGEEKGHSWGTLNLPRLYTVHSSALCKLKSGFKGCSNDSCFLKFNCVKSNSYLFLVFNYNILPRYLKDLLVKHLM